MSTGVIGGTGMIGSNIVGQLAGGGEEVRILTRTPPARMAEGVTHARIDLATGEGLEAGLEGVDTLIDAGNTCKSPEDTLVEGTRRILETCANQGVGHYVGISIVGCEKVDMGYYKAKTAQEAVIRSSPVGWSLLRATQFHELIEAVFRGAANRGVTPRSSIPLQTVAASEAARSMVALSASTPTDSTTELTGPEVLTVTEMGKIWRRVMGRKTVPLPLPTMGKAMKALRHGALTDPKVEGSGPTFEQWLNLGPANQ